MNKPDLTSPRRTSLRPAQSRFDAVVDRRDNALESGMLFKAVPVNVVKGVQRFRLQLAGDNDQIVGLGALDDELRTAGLNLHADAVEGMINTLCNILPRYMARTGRSVRIGNLVTLKLFATGSIAHSNDPATPPENHLEIRATVSPSMRYALSNMKLVNAAGAQSAILHILGSTANTYGEVAPGDEVTIDGRAIYVAPAGGDAPAKGRVWIESTGGEKIGDCEVVMSNDTVIKARMRLDATPADGRITFVVETFGTREEAARGDTLPRTCRHTVTLAPAARG